MQKRERWRDRNFNRSCSVVKYPILPCRLVKLLPLTRNQKEHSASFIPPSSTTSKSLLPLPYPSPLPPRTAPTSYTPFLALDCRGLEFTKYHFRGKWRCRGSESSTPFEFDLDELAQEGGEDEGRWDDYDEKAGEAVGVSEMMAKVERM